MSATSNEGITRIVTIDADPKSLTQSWAIKCATCPLKPHTNALGLPTQACASGVMTHVQGAVPLNMCKHYVRESVKFEGDAVTARCLRADDGVQG